MAAVLTVCLMAPPVSAQDAEGTLMFTAASATGGPAASPPCPNVAFSMTSESPEDGKAYAGPSTPGAACTTHFIYTVGDPFAFAGDATVTFYISCDNPTYFGTPATFPFRVNLFKNAAQISTTNVAGGQGACTGPGTVTQVVASKLPTKNEAFAAGDIFRVAILAWHSGAADAADPSVHFRIGPSHPSRVAAIGLPTGAPSGPGTGPVGTVRENLTGEAAEVNHSFVDATNATYQYNWTAANRTLELLANATVLSGSVNVTIVDALNETVYNQTLDGNQSVSVPIEGEAGNWTIRLAYANFTGNVSLDLRPAAHSAMNTTSQTGTGSGMAATPNNDNRTGTFPLSYEEKTPALGPIAVLLLVAIAGIVARRRIR